jgi:hypothetical protein
MQQKPDAFSDTHHATLQGMAGLAAAVVKAESRQSADRIRTKKAMGKPSPPPQAWQGFGHNLITFDNNFGGSSLEILPNV